MSEYPYEDKIHSDDRVNYRTVYSSDGIALAVYHSTDRKSPL